ncbi:hypothetical protein AVEN_160703-1 [Araneus ventricosus]|uniref:Uncharacterized protein n=1 Tax=Araneus ventricosus TaxID=182803 RepID=A0A4Y2TX95_ARAVE|nr:hypothetical protein AVEN_160703-1 [Araneus ventricosus]
MNNTTVPYAFSISLNAPEDCRFAVTSSSITSCCEAQCNSMSSSVVSSWLYSSTNSSISLLSTSSPLILAKDTILLTTGSTGLSQTPQCHIRQHFPTNLLLVISSQAFSIILRQLTM